MGLGSPQEAEILPRPGLHEDNRVTWNAATRVHNSLKHDQATFLGAGGSTLLPEEVEPLERSGGKGLPYLQCNAGQDTLALARLGATVTGVDISDEVIAFATVLTDAGLATTSLREYPYSNGAKLFDRMREKPGRRMLPPDDVPALSLMFGMVATTSA